MKSSMPRAAITVNWYKANDRRNPDFGEEEEWRSDGENRVYEV